MKKFKEFLNLKQLHEADGLPPPGGGAPPPPPGGGMPDPGMGGGMPPMPMGGGGGAGGLPPPGGGLGAPSMGAPGASGPQTAPNKPTATNIWQKIREKVKKQENAGPSKKSAPQPPK